MSSAQKYRAFFSYCHADRPVAEKLHRALETYRVPPELVGKQGAYGPIPANLRPIFRDRDDMIAGHSLTKAVRDALDRSDALIVVCSPASAKSPYVQEEVRLFKSKRGAERVFPIIVAGEPGGVSNDCFPSTLRQRFDASGKMFDLTEEPIAADMRAQGDGPELAELKLIAGLLGVGLDELRKREEIERRRRTRRMAALAAAMTICAVLATGSGLYALQQKREAVAAKDRAVAAQKAEEAAKLDAQKRYEQALRLSIDSMIHRATYESVVERRPFPEMQLALKGEDNTFWDFVRQNSSKDRDHIWQELSNAMLEFSRSPPYRLARFHKEIEWAERGRAIIETVVNRDGMSDAASAAPAALDHKKLRDDLDAQIMALRSIPPNPNSRQLVCEMKDAAASRE